jgi:hypothetical protein
MSLFTCIFNFEGGIYISQIQSTSPREAMFKWAADLSQEAIPEMDENMKHDLVSDLNDLDADYPVPINGTLNTWGFSVLPLGHLGIGNLILTVEST